jgi:hypothetical protein
MKTYRERLAECPTLELTAGRYVHRVHADDVAREADAAIASAKERIEALEAALRPFVEHGTCFEPHHIENARALLTQNQKEEKR